MEVGHLLVEWRVPPVKPRSRIPVRWGWIPSVGVRRNGCWTHPLLFDGGWGGGFGTDNNNIVSDILVCSSFLISVCMFIVSRVLQ